MSNSYKNIFVFDIDGTLMKPSHNELDKESIIALNKVSEYGEIVFASARPLPGIKSLYSENEFKIKHIIALNGAQIRSSDGTSVLFPVSSGVVNFFLERSEKFRNIWFYSEKNWFSNYINSTEYLIEKNAVSFDAVLLNNFKGEDVLKITVVYEEAFNSAMSQLNALSSEVDINASTNSYIEIQSNKTNKYLATKYLFPDSDIRIFSFADSDNDIDLLKNSFFSCTVRNASGKAKSVSGYISDREYGKGVLDSVNYVIKNLLYP